MAGTLFFRAASVVRKLYSVSNANYASSSLHGYTACSDFLSFFKISGSSSNANNYVPALRTKGAKTYAGKDTDNRDIYYDTSSPTVAFRKNGTIFYCAKSRTVVTYDIPAGTYSPAAFYRLMCGFFTTPLYSTGGTTSYRTAANAFTVTVNNKTYVVPAGRRIAFGNVGSSQPYGIVQTNFNGDSASVGNTGATADFISKGYYVTYMEHGPPSFLYEYGNFPITIKTGIRFS